MLRSWKWQCLAACPLPSCSPSARPHGRRLRSPNLIPTPSLYHPSPCCPVLPLWSRPRWPACPRRWLRRRLDRRLDGRRPGLELPSPRTRVALWLAAAPRSCSLQHSAGRPPRPAIAGGRWCDGAGGVLPCHANDASSRAMPTCLMQAPRARHSHRRVSFLLAARRYVVSAAARPPARRRGPASSRAVAEARERRMRVQYRTSCCRQARELDSEEGASPIRLSCPIRCQSGPG